MGKGMTRRKSNKSAAATNTGGKTANAKSAGHSTSKQDSIVASPMNGGGMMPTPTSIATMNEATLRQQVLIPLFEAMGYRHVREFHHPRELGKDIVAWKLGADGARENHAVVAKAAPLNGQAGWGPGSVSEVMAQVHQCFGDPFPDLATGALSPVDHCWIITNKAVTPEARVALSAALRGSPHAGKLTIVDHRSLWDLIREHIPRVFFADADELAARGAALDTHYTVDIETHNGQTTYVVNEKYPGAFDERPLTFEIDAVPGREEVLEALRRVQEDQVEVQLTDQAARAIRLVRHS